MVSVRCGATISIGVVAFATLVPLLVSFMYGGWTAEFTSAPHFKVEDIPNLAGKFAIVTGANTGIGKQTALELARAGATVFLGSRSVTKGATAKAWIDDELEGVAGKGRVVVQQLDLARFASISAAAANIKAATSKIDILVLNAGVMKSPGELFAGQKYTYGFEQTFEGFEYHIGVNHIGHFYLTSLLDAEIRAAEAPRVVSVSSAAEQGASPQGMDFHMWKTEGMPAEYEDGVAYGQSKLANILFARELAKRMTSSGAPHVTVYSLHPGLIDTELSRYMMEEMANQALGSKLKTFANAMFQKVFENVMFTPRGGALTQLYCATQAIDPAFNGGYFIPVGLHVAPTHPKSSDDELAATLWAKTEAAIAGASGN